MGQPNRQVVILLGAPGSGKTTIGHELAALGYRFRDWEQVVVDRWGSREAFVAAKDVALGELHDQIRAWIAADDSVAVIETTGLSDGPFVDELDGSGGAFVVRLDVSEDESVRRVSARPVGAHLTDEPEANRVVWHAFVSVVVAHRRIDLVIDTGATRPADAARVVADALAA